MGFTLGIVGLPNVGKSTIFNCLSNAKAQAANFPFCTIDPNVGVVEVPDKRLQTISDIFSSAKITRTTIEFYDIAGLVKGASKGEGLGNKFLGKIREVDAIAQVVRCFADPNIVHVDGSVDPVRDIEIINYELIMADLDTVDKKLSQANKAIKSNDKNIIIEISALEKLKKVLSEGKLAKNAVLEEDEQMLIKPLFLMTLKPMLYIGNIDESQIKDLSAPAIKALEEKAKQDQAPLVLINARLEEELYELNDEEKKELLKEYGVAESGLDKMIREGYKLLGLTTFFTGGPTEARSWTVESGAKAPAAAGRIHSDMERGFIKADVVHIDDLVECGNYNVAKEKGKLRFEGKEYVIKDGDVVLFKFNV